MKRVDVGGCAKNGLHKATFIALGEERKGRRTLTKCPIQQARMMRVSRGKGGKEDDPLGGSP